MMAEHARYTDFFLCILRARAGTDFVKNFFIKKNYYYSRKTSLQRGRLGSK